MATTANQQILNSWKEIAAYMGRGVRTVQRWERLGLPVRRPAGHPRSAVFALSSDIDHWLKTRNTHICHTNTSPQETLLRNRVLVQRMIQLLEEQEELRKKLLATLSNMLMEDMAQIHALPAQNGGLRSAKPTKMRGPAAGTGPFPPETFDTPMH